MKGVMKLLIVDDEPDICEFTKMFFESQNLKVYVALDGKQALDIIAREHPHVILLDILMRGMSGLDVLRQVKRTKVSIDVIMVTALDDTAVADEARRIGACDYITKPLVLEELEEKVQSRMARICAGENTETTG